MPTYHRINAQSETSILIAVVFCDEMKEGGNCILKKIWPFNEQYIPTYIYTGYFHSGPSFFVMILQKKGENSKRVWKSSFYRVSVQKYNIPTTYLFWIDF